MYIYHATMPVFPEPRWLNRRWWFWLYRGELPSSWYVGLLGRMWWVLFR